jgi:signal transduction histidine kinase/HAMP domain-containing protein
MRRAVRPLQSLRVRVVAAFVVAIAAMFGAQTFLLLQNAAVSSSLTRITDGYLPMARFVAQLDRDRQRVANDLRRLTDDRPRPVASSPAHFYTEQLATTLARGREAATRAQSTPGLPADERAVFNKILTQFELIEQLFRDYQAGSQEVFALHEAGRRDEAAAQAKQLVHAGNALGEEVEKLDRLVNTRIRRLAAETEAAQGRATAIAGALTGGAALLGLGLLAAVLYALAPVSRLTAQVQAVAAGDYSGRLQVGGASELAVLADEINAMAEAIATRDRALVERAEELNRLSRYLGSVLDSLGDALLVVEGAVVTRANPAARARWGAIEGAAPPEPLSRVTAEGARASELHDAGGRLHEVRVTPFGEAGRVITVADITEQTAAKARLARSERLALVGQMLAQITHEVRNPLNALSLNAELLGEELGDLDPAHHTEAWELHAMIAREIERLTAVTGHYLQLARRPPAQLAPEDPGVLVSDVVRLLEPEFAQAGARLEVALEAVPVGLVDGNQLRQALLNVLRNALQAEAGHVRLTGGLREGVLLIAVHDDGRGMSPEEIARATDPFFSTKASGTGLGLAITRQILEDHDGAVELCPGEGGVGTTVTLTLPWRTAEETAA